MFAQAQARQQEHYILVRQRRLQRSAVKPS